MDDCYDPRQRELRFGVQSSIWKNPTSKLPSMIKLERLELDRVRNFTSLRQVDIHVFTHRHCHYLYIN